MLIVNQLNLHRPIYIHIKFQFASFPHVSTPTTTNNVELKIFKNIKVYIPTPYFSTSSFLLSFLPLLTKLWIPFHGTLTPLHDASTWLFFFVSKCIPSSSPHFLIVTYTSRNWPKGNHSICDYT